jgi:hypothetical protein
MPAVEGLAGVPEDALSSPSDDVFVELELASLGEAHDALSDSPLPQPVFRLRERSAAGAKTAEKIDPPDHSLQDEAVGAGGPLSLAGEARGQVRVCACKAASDAPSNHRDDDAYIVHSGTRGSSDYPELNSGFLELAPGLGPLPDSSGETKHFPQLCADCGGLASEREALRSPSLLAVLSVDRLAEELKDMCASSGNVVRQQARLAQQAVVFQCYPAEGRDAALSVSDNLRWLWRSRLWIRCVIGLAWVLVVLQGLCSVAAMQHYMVDIFIAWYVVPLVWIVYDTYFPDACLPLAKE